MPQGVKNDHFVVIKIEGMHCHKCQQTIRQAIQKNAGVHEVEVDFPSGQASVLFAPSQVTVRRLMDAVTEAGYRPTGFSKGNSRRSHKD